MSKYLKAFNDTMDLSELKQILKDAPEGATHICDKEYYQLDGVELAIWRGSFWTTYHGFVIATRSLEDIAKIVELMSDK